MHERHEEDIPAMPLDIGSAAPELIEALIESVDDAIYLVDPEGRVRFLNPAALRILGYDRPEELIGRVSHPTIHYQHRDGTPFPAEDCPMLRPRTTGETVRVELDWFTRRDGRMVPVAYSSAPLMTAEGRGAVVAFRDVSDRLAREAMRRSEAAERARAAELAASRTRILRAMDLERQRLGRDLHDGAQQRLLHTLLLLQDSRHESDDQAEREAVRAAAIGELRAAIAELRELAAGIHPAILSGRGLAAAVASVTARVPLPVDLEIPELRFAEQVEVGAYFVISEALANVTKHAASASGASVRVTASPATLRLEIADDGPGGARMVPGHGLAGLHDRVGALGGTLELTSPVGAGTTITVDLPLG